MGTIEQEKMPRAHDQGLSGSLLPDHRALRPNASYVKAIETNPDFSPVLRDRSPGVLKRVAFQAWQGARLAA